MKQISLRGLILKPVLEYFIHRNLFEQMDSIVLDRLQVLLKSTFSFHINVTMQPDDLMFRLNYIDENEQECEMHCIAKTIHDNTNELKLNINIYEI